jgi:diaminohydroxyphosphoribosylaminopyrimidine deaminase / 5-amino-6-(5-phosphoribosylamino)uracil reductase
MQRCLQLAKLGVGYVAPNPLVGAVLVYNHKIIGEGYHKMYGQAHAEVNCINSVAPNLKEFIPNSTLYVSLEPCAHYGKTPPCANFIVANGIKHVVVGCNDSYEKVDGKGILYLKEHGVLVEQGILEDECLALNKPFFTFHTQERPYIVLKWAKSADGFIGKHNGQKVKITNEISDALVHKWRTQYSSIMVGKNTLVNDDPLLTARGIAGKQPIKIIIAPSGLSNFNLNVFTTNTPTLVFTNAPQSNVGNVNFVPLNNPSNFLNATLTALYKLNIQSILIEGGQQLLQGFINANLWDEAFVFTNTSLQLTQGVASPIFNYSNPFAVKKLGTDLLQHFKNNN